MTKKGLILINAYCKLESNTNQAERLKKEFELLGVEIDIVRNKGFKVFVDEFDFVNNLGEYDFCVYLDKDKYISDILEKSGIRLFNSHEAIRICDDKMRTFIELSGKGVKLVKTLAGMLCYTKGAEVDLQDLEKVEKELGYPVIVKECYGSLGRGIYKAETREELLSLMQKLIYTPHIFQKCVKSSIGKDTRVILVGGKVCAAMQRISKVDFRSNIELGGVGQKVELKPSYIETAQKTAKALGLDYCGIDILDGEDGEPVICEVNSNAFFGGIEKVTGVNVAKIYAEYICGKIY